MAETSTLTTITISIGTILTAAIDRAIDRAAADRVVPVELAVLAGPVARAESAVLAGPVARAEPADLAVPVGLVESAGLAELAEGNGNTIPRIGATRPTVIAQQTTNLVKPTIVRARAPALIVQAQVPAREIGPRLGRPAEIDQVAAEVQQIVHQRARPVAVVQTV
jgi:hypothetical protein